MKTYFTLITIAAGALLSGCATAENGLSLDTVGPASSQLAKAAPANGTLVVYSAYEVGPDFNQRDPYRPEYSDYKIFETDGKLLQRIHNDSGTLLQDPALVKLSPGKYKIVARANGYGRVTVPIVIAAGQRTVLHLEGGDLWPDESVFSQTNAVYLPDGQIVGWKAAPHS